MTSEPKRQSSTSEFEELVQKNVEAVKRIEQATHAVRTHGDAISDAIASFCGRPLFAYVHCAWFASWLLWNGLMGPRALRFDSPPFNVLTLIVSLEAIFLSSFILISQNRQQRVADQRNHLDLQINLLAEQENSQMLVMMKQVMDHLGIAPPKEAAPLLETTDPELLAERIGDTLDAGATTQ